MIRVAVNAIKSSAYGILCILPLMVMLILPAVLLIRKSASAGDFGGFDIVVQPGQADTAGFAEWEQTPDTGSEAMGEAPAGDAGYLINAEGYPGGEAVDWYTDSQSGGSDVGWGYEGQLIDPAAGATDTVSGEAGQEWFSSDFFQEDTGSSGGTDLSDRTGSSAGTDFPDWTGSALAGGNIADEWGTASEGSQPVSAQSGFDTGQPVGADRYTTEREQNPEGGMDPYTDPLPTEKQEPTPTDVPTSTPEATVTPIPADTPAATATPLPSGEDIASASMPSGSADVADEAALTEQEENLTYYRKDGARKKKKKVPPVYWEIREQDGFGIRIRSEASIGVLSFRINDREVPWHWDKDLIRADSEPPVEERSWSLVLLGNGKKVIRLAG